MAIKIDISKLRGEDLFTYFTQDHPDREYASVVSLLRYLPDYIKILERCVDENKTVIAFYPEFDKEGPDAEYLGEIPDGSLYIK